MKPCLAALLTVWSTDRQADWLTDGMTDGLTERRTTCSYALAGDSSQQRAAFRCFPSPMSRRMFRVTLSLSLSISFSLFLSPSLSLSLPRSLASESFVAALAVEMELMRDRLTSQTDVAVHAKAALQQTLVASQASQVGGRAGGCSCVCARWWVCVRGGEKGEGGGGGCVVG